VGTEAAAAAVRYPPDPAATAHFDLPNGGSCTS
jgi:hypothetical protein